MDEETKAKILTWIFKSHEHHDEGCDCVDKDFPYVNSIELEKFINKLH
jgi:hypothetical protein